MKLDVKPGEMYELYHKYNKTDSHVILYRDGGPKEQESLKVGDFIFIMHRLYHNKDEYDVYVLYNGKEGYFWPTDLDSDYYRKVEV